MFIDLGKIQTKPKTSKNPNGDGFYIKITEDVEITIKGTNFKGEKFNRVLKKGDIISIQDERERVMFLNKNKTEAERQERLNKIPDFVKYHLMVPPEKVEQPEAEEEPVMEPKKTSFKRNKK